MAFNEYCTSCGTRLMGQSRYCPSCGARQEYSAVERIVTTEPFAHEPGVEGRTGRSSPLTVWFWLVAASPIMAIALAIIIGAVAGPTYDSAALGVGWLATDVAAIVFAAKDVRYLVQSGERTISSHAYWWALLIPWAYLVYRVAKRPTRTAVEVGVAVGAAVVWLVGLVAGAAIVASLVIGVSSFNRANVEAAIAKGIERQTGATVTVVCPASPSIRAGSTFQCAAMAAGVSVAFVDVTIEDNSGSYIWKVEG